MKNEFLVRAMAAVAVVLLIVAIVIALLVYPANAIYETEGLAKNKPRLVAEEAISSGEYAPKPTYTADDLRMLAATIWYEAPYCTDRHQQLVAMVVLNRVADPRFPDTIYGVITQPGQYGDGYACTVLDTANETVQRCYANAKAALDGKVDCPADVIFQAEFVQGREVYEVIEVDTGWYRSTTWFCYG